MLKNSFFLKNKAQPTISCLEHPEHFEKNVQKEKKGENNPEKRLPIQVLSG